MNVPGARLTDEQRRLAASHAQTCRMIAGRYFRRFGLSYEDALDLCHDTLMRAAQYYRGQCTFGTILTKCCRWRMIEYIRYKNKLRRGGSYQHSEVLPRNLTHDPWPAVEARDMCQWLAGKLSSADQELIASRLDGTPLRIMASTAGVNKSWVCIRRQQAYARARRLACSS